MIKLNKVNEMYVCPKCGSPARMEFTVGKRNDFGYPVVVNISCKNECLGIEKIKFVNLYQAHDAWNKFVEDYVKSNNIDITSFE